ncbi:uncharacterized protein LOC129766723 [Toxorhynchites rutilus septentrionalis]|uniref:uncharacterized protein LOC129766723 n=1 Tax=Toxorhynchites rutilus septentrionalis TaxID=329112 RepID=UPI002479915C|nr:uncharacterized protein LOC129766723 [Toxorhynchites rutilus septentrionalis]
MFTKLFCITALAISCVCAKPGLAPLAYSAPLVAAAAPAFVTAQSSQVVARNYNGIAPLAYTAAAVAAPLAYTAAPVAKVAAPLAYTAAGVPFAYSAPALAAAAPLAYRAGPIVSPYAAYSPYLLPLNFLNPQSVGHAASPLRSSVRLQRPFQHNAPRHLAKVGSTRQNGHVPITGLSDGECNRTSYLSRLGRVLNVNPTAVSSSEAEGHTIVVYVCQMCAFDGWIDVLPPKFVCPFCHLPIDGVMKSKFVGGFGGELQREYLPMRWNCAENFEQRKLKSSKQYKMFTKLIFLATLAISCVCAKPGLAPLAYSAPLVTAAGPAFVTAQSSQVVARNYNGIAPLAYTAAAPLAYPLGARVAAPLAYTATGLAAPAPLAYTASPYAPYVTSPLAAYAAASPLAAYRPYLL